MSWCSGFVARCDVECGGIARFGRGGCVGCVDGNGIGVGVGVFVFVLGVGVGLWFGK